MTRPYHAWRRHEGVPAAERWPDRAVLAPCLQIPMLYRFEQCLLDTRRRELWRDGEPAALRPKVFALLVLLIEERDRVVGREMLFERIWPGRFVSDATLSSCVKELRKALGDTGATRRCIRTVHGQGFRFVASVAIEEARTDEARAPHEPSPASGGLVPASAVAEGSGRDGGAEAGSREPAPPRPDVPPADAAWAERKGVSALRCALLDAEAVAGRLGPEPMHRLMQCLFSGVRDIVGRYDGQIVQWSSDGCLALFGAPRAHDDDARRAVLAAADIHGCCRALREEHGVAIACGVASGVVIVGGVPGRP